MKLVCEVWVPGVPKPKGSMDHIGNGRMRQSVKGSTEWARLVTHAAQRAMSPGSTIPRDCAAAVRCVFFMPAPAALTAGWPDWMVTETPAIHERVGDIDKLERNILDALKSAGVYVDDVQVDSLSSERVYADPSRGFAPGVYIQAWEREPTETAYRRTSLERAASAAMQRAVHGAAG